MLPKIALVARALKLPGESGCKCSLRDLGGAVLTCVGTCLGKPLGRSAETNVALAHAKGAQMLLQRQVPSLRADANPGPHKQECIAVHVLLHGPSTNGSTCLDV